MNIIYAKLKDCKRIAKRIFPNLHTEIIVAFIVILTLMFSASVVTTATIGHEMTLMNINNADVETEPTLPPQQSDFEISVDDTKPTTQTIEYQTSQMCFIGDSRTVGMSGSVVTDAHFIAKSSMGLNWFNDTASVSFEKIKDDVELCIVALGINDIHNAEKYIVRLNEFAEQYTDKILIYVNIGPVDQTKYTGIPNSALETFNEKMQNGLSDKWQIVDQYSYLTNEGFDSYDGLHYSFQDSAKIFTWIVDTVKTQTIAVAG